MALLIPPDILMKTAVRFMKEKTIKENTGDTVPPGRESHIWNLYEDLGMPLSGIIDIAKLALEGKLENAQEKVDGQNITFTVRDGVLRFFTKMSLVSDRDLNNARSKIQSGRGMDLSLISEKYGDKPGIVAAFSMGYEALEPVALQFQDSLFKNGDVVIVSGLITSVNPSTIIYDADTFRFIAPVSLTEDPVDESAYGKFLQQARAATTEAFSMDSVPVAKLIDELEADDAEIDTLMGDLESVVGDAGLSVESATVGQYVAARVEKLLREKYSFIPDEMIVDVTNRFVTGRGAVANKLKKLVSIEDYQRFRHLDGLKSEVVAEAIVPLEAVIQRLGVMIIDKLDLTLTASNHDDLRAFVRRARDAFSKGKILADEKTLERIRVALARLEENEELFTKATEGIVFTYNGNTYKLTGLFTPINRLRGFFDYDRKATIQNDKAETGETLQERIRRAAARFVLEGGEAFKDSKGERVTVQERIPREVAQRIISDLKTNVFDDLGLQVGYGGSTNTDPSGRRPGWKPMSTLGDIDLVVYADENSYQDIVNRTSDEVRKFRDPDSIDIPPANKLASDEEKAARKKLLSKRNSMRSRMRGIEKGTRTSTPFKDSVFVELVNHPYFKRKLHPDIHVNKNVKFMGHELTAMVSDEDGRLYQVDIKPVEAEESIDDELWSMSGGGESEAKGRYRNMMVGRIAKLLGIEETLSLSPDSPIEKIGITINLPGRGYTKLITMKDGTKERELVRDPDSYLPLLGIRGNKNELRSFEQLVDYMVKNPNPIFNLALNLQATPPQDPDGWSAYIARYPQTENDVTIDYIKSKKENLLESLIRHQIQNILEEGSIYGGAYDPPSGKEKLSLSNDAKESSQALKKSGLPTEEEIRLEIPKKINKAWLKSKSVDSPLYDRKTQKFISEGVPFLLLGMDDSAKSNKGEMFEDGIALYANSLGLGNMKVIGMPGQDLEMDGIRYEAKTSEKSELNLLFNSTFPKADKDLFYMFVTNVPTRKQVREQIQLLALSLGMEDGVANTWSNWDDEIKHNFTYAWKEDIEVSSEATSDVRDQIDLVQDKIDSWKEGESITLKLLTPKETEKEFKTKDELIQYKGELEGALADEDEEISNDTPDITSIETFHNLGGKMEVYMVPSVLLRETIAESAFKGVFSRDGSVDVNRLTSQIEEYLSTFKLAEKIVRKIVPEEQARIRGGTVADLKKDLGTMSMNMGLLNVRIRINIEPKGEYEQGVDFQEEE